MTNTAPETPPVINKMNVADCHAPWQTPHDWYLVGAWGDGCDFVAVQGWASVVAKWCEFFIGGQTIQHAIDTEADFLIDFAIDWADADKWQHRDNGPDRKPHQWDSGEILECTYGTIILLTEPPRVQLPPLEPDLIKILGMPNFQCIHYADALRDDGHDIPRKSEAEQAHTLQWLLGIYLKDPANAGENIAKEIEALVARVAAKIAAKSEALKP